MALKLPDSAVPMGDFPVAKAVDIDFDDGENLQEKMDNGTLGGGGGERVYTNTPIGTVLSFAGLTAPNGYLLCDGGSYAVADYQDLYDAIGNIYGGDTEYFNVPNLINKFVQGSDISGTEKQAGLPNITGSISKNTTADSADFFCDITTTSIDTIGALSIGDYVRVKTISNTSNYNECPSGIVFDASRSNTIYGNSDTVQPPALTMIYVIKALHTNEGADSSVEFEDNVINHINNRIDSRVTERMSDLFQSVSDGKTLVANAITDKGVSTATDATFATMASNIRNLNGIGYESERKSVTKAFEPGTTMSVSMTFSNTVLGVTEVKFAFENDQLQYYGLSISGGTVTVKIKVGLNASKFDDLICSVTANILA